MDTHAKIYVAGHAGLVGSALVCKLQESGYDNLVLRTRQQLDLTDPSAVTHFFATERPEYVFLAAARVGGILANATFPVEFLSENLRIELNVIQEAFRTNVRRLLFLGSSCVYPKLAPQPIQETHLLSGPLEFTNRAYAVAKIAGIELCWAYNREHGSRFMAVMPSNLYGKNDNYDLQSSHVVPALIRKFDDAKISGSQTVQVWGSGAPLREFLLSDDAADACVFLMNLDSGTFSLLLDSDERPPIVNVGGGEEISIRALSELIAEVVGFRGEMIFDSHLPDGTPRKLLDSHVLKQLGWAPKVSLREGLVTAYQDFCRKKREAEKPDLTSASLTN